MSSTNLPTAEASAPPPTPRRDYPAGVPGKFDPDGHVQPFPGNTIVCHLAPTSTLYASLLQLYDKLASSSLSHLYALLPPRSWHMTLFEGVCDQVRLRAYWAADLPLDIPLADCTAVFAKKLSSFDLQCEPPYRLKVAGFDPLQVGIGVHVEAQTESEEARLRGVRDRLSDCLQMRFPVHEHYGFHLSMAYLVRYLTDDEEAELKALLESHLREMPVEFELGAPEFCTFEDMFFFNRLFYLQNQPK